MSDDDFGKLVERYRKLRLGTIDFSFVLLWRRQLDRFELQDLLDAVDSLAADPRAKFPINDLPAILEFVQERAARREKWKDPLAGQPSPVLSTRWNEFMLSRGLITKQEFDRRERERGAESADGADSPPTLPFGPTVRAG
jgi:hypothetical protein